MVDGKVYDISNTVAALGDMCSQLLSLHVQDWNFLPKALLPADSLKAFKAGVVSVEHHLPY